MMTHTPNPLIRSRERISPLKALVLVLVFIVSCALFYQLAQRPSSDLSIHATWAGEGDFLAPRTFVRHGAHPLWHALVAFVMLFGVPLEWAASVVTALIKTAEIWLMQRLFSQHLSVSQSRSTALGLVCGFVSCLWLPFYNPTVYLGVGTPNTWHSPTQLIAMLFMLVCVPYTAHCYDTFEKLEKEKGPEALLPWRKPIVLGALLLLSLVAKPTFMQAFLPAACLYFLYQWIRHPKNSRFFWQIIVCVLPSVLFMIVQYMYYFGIIVPSQGNMVLELSVAKFLRVIISTVLIQAFPIYVLITRRRDGERGSFFRLTLLFDIVGIVEFLILGEDGRRAADGNFGWGMMGAALMMWVVTMIHFFRGLSCDRAQNRRLPRTRIIGLALLTWHLLSGLYYIVYLFTTTNPL